MTYDYFEQFHDITALVERPHVRIDYLYRMGPLKICTKQLLVRDSALVLAQRKMSRPRTGFLICD